MKGAVRSGSFEDIVQTSLREPVVDSLSAPYHRWMKVHEVIARIEADGWYLARTRGSHRQFKHPSKSGTVTVSGKRSMDVPLGTLRSIFKQAGGK